MSVIQKFSVNAHNLHTELPFFNLNNADLIPYSIVIIDV